MHSLVVVVKLLVKLSASLTSGICTLTSPRLVASPFQGMRRGIVQGTSPFRQGDDVDVIEESELQVADCVMLRQGVKGGHQGVALFAALALAHLMQPPVVIAPRVDARRRVELPSEGQERVELAC